LVESQELLREGLAAALRAGQMLLENGATTARVEETVRRMGLAFGASQVEVFATPTGVFATVISGPLHTTRVLRIAKIEYDLSKVEAVLTISRQVVAGTLNAAEALAALQHASTVPRPFGLPIAIPASAVCCAASAGLFGSSIAEIAATAAAAALGYLIFVLLTRIQLTRIVSTGIASAVATGIAFAFATRLGSTTPAVAMQAAILMLTPGVAIVSSIADLFRGDTLSGITRAAMALFTVAAIATGVWVVIAVNGVVMVLPAVQPPVWPIALAMAAAMTAGFAMLFGVPPRRLVACILAGVVAYAADRLASEYGAPAAVAMFAGGAAVGLFADLLARMLHAPALIFLIPGIITLVPGGLAFRTMLAFAQGDVATGATNLVLTALLAGGLAVGFGVVTALSVVRLPVRKHVNM
jgi:uncharacterized membrane protein YjjP (DUF1212 family)